MSAPVTDGDRFARARIEFLEAMAAGCTILDLRRRKRALAHRAQAEISRIVSHGPPAHPLASSEHVSPYWWMRD